MIMYMCMQSSMCVHFNVCVQSDMALHVDVYSFALFVLIGCMCICVYVSVWCMSSYMLTYDAMYVNVCQWSVLHTL